MTSENASPVDPSPQSGQPVRYTVEDGVGTIAFDRPEAMNSLDLATKVVLLARVREAAEDPAVRCVVLTGSGRAFCVGQDLKEHVAGLMSGDEGLAATVDEHYNPVAELLATMDKPVVAALNGVAAGAGASMAMAADFRVMVEGGGMNLAFAAIALSCDTGASFWLPRLVGIARAKDLLLRPRTVPAAECLDLGLVTSVVPAESFDEEVTTLARALAAGPTRAYGAIRRAIAFSATHPLPEALAFERDRMDDTGRTMDHRAAVEAFLAKTPPVFQGR